ncbi:hypothetical protein [Sphaerisporangium aureirubrum]|uniref:DUF2269 domain-containing protein n=1 Tax=Sphaerisporangium aureirubrum TaxID=1544736 RepID=A0ABW1NMH4_9ACTN
MPPALRKLTLTVHVSLSVGWLGAIAVFLALAVLELAAPDERTARATYLVMAPTAWFVLVPLSLAALVTGLVQSLGTNWGLFRHYWIIFKLTINILAATVVVLYAGSVSHLADMAAAPDESAADALWRTPSPLLHAVGGLLLVIGAVVLSVYKPRGVTPYGRRRERAIGRTS